MSTRHRYADVITAWAERGPKAIQWRTALIGKWRDWTADSTPYFHQPNIEWRIKPRMCSLNGYEFPAPERDAPESESTYWTPHHTGTCLFSGWVWRNTSFNHACLSRGRVHLSKDAAIAHARAEILAVGGTLEGES